MISKPMVHMNSNILCSIGIETTGPIPIEHELFQVAVMPLNFNMEMDKKINPFVLTLKPHHPLQYDPKYAQKEQLSRACTTGIDPYTAADMFQTWFDKLNLPEGKRIMPICYDWPYCSTFLRQWLQPTQFSSLFHEWYRDILPISLYNNDVADLHIEQIPYPKSKFKYILAVLKIDNLVDYDPLMQAHQIAQAYKAMLKRLF